MKKVLVLLLALSGCATTQHYRNVSHPAYGQAEFDRDSYECDRENTHQIGVLVSGGPGVMSTEVDRNMAARCLALRGWQQVSE